MTSMEQGEQRRKLTDVFRRARHGYGENISARGASSSGRVRAQVDGQQSESETEERPWKRARTGANEGYTKRQEEVEATMRALEEEFEEKVRQSHGGVWCEPVPHERKVGAVREFYKAFHDVRTLAVHTCTICYRKFAMAELEEFESDQPMLADSCVSHGAQFGCVECFGSGRTVFGCAECVKNLERGVLSPAAHVHGRLRCEHVLSGRAERLDAGRGEADRSKLLLRLHYEVQRRQRLPGERNVPKTCQGPYNSISQQCAAIGHSCLAPSVVESDGRDPRVVARGRETCPERFVAPFVGKTARSGKGAGVAEAEQPALCRHRYRHRGNGELGQVSARGASSGL